MIAFTVDNPDKPELLNNRKTTRQLFMYKVGSGVLLQSRLYNTSGGTRGAQKESDLYRDLIQRELSALENVPNLWKTEKYIGNKFKINFDAGYGFGGYPDWLYSEFDAKVSVRADHIDDYSGFSIGTYGLCIRFGCEISEGLYCSDCSPNDFGCCGICNVCGEYHDLESMEFINGDYWVFQNCLETHYEQCNDCGHYYHVEYSEMREVHDCYGNEIRVCHACRHVYYSECVECGRLFNDDDLVDGLCASCRSKEKV